MSHTIPPLHLRHHPRQWVLTFLIPLFYGPADPQAVAMLVSLTHDLEKNLHSCIHATSELAFSVKSFTPEKVGQIPQNAPVPQQGTWGCSKPLHTFTQGSHS